MIKYLNDLKISQSFADIFRDRIEADTLRGRIVDVSAELIQVERYADDGEYEGLSFILPDHVTRVRSKGRELDEMVSLAAGSNRKPPGEPIKARTLWDAVEATQNVHGFVVLHVEDMNSDFCVIGEVLEHDSDFVRLREYGTLQTRDRREIVLDRGAITRVDCDGAYERMISSIGED